MLAKKKYPREFVEEKKPDLEMEKKIASLRAIRKSRLDRHEMEYRQCANSLAAAKVEHQQACANIEVAKQKFLQDKAALQKKMVGLQMTPNLLSSWMRSEEVLADCIVEAKESAQRKLEKVAQCEKILEQANTIYRESLLGIEKLDVLKEEMDKEKEENQ